MEEIGRFHDLAVAALVALRDEVGEHTRDIADPKGWEVELYEAPQVTIEQLKAGEADLPELAQVEVYPGREPELVTGETLPETMVMTYRDGAESRRVVMELFPAGAVKPDWTMLEVELIPSLGVREDEMPTAVQYRKHSDAEVDEQFGWNKLEINGVELERAGEVVESVKRQVAGMEVILRNILAGKYHARIVPLGEGPQAGRFLEAAGE